MPAFDINKQTKQGELGKDMKPGYDYRYSTTGKLNLTKEDNSMTKVYPKSGKEPTNGFGTAYDMSLIKAYPKAKTEGAV